MRLAFLLALCAIAQLHAQSSARFSYVNLTDAHPSLSKSDLAFLNAADSLAWTRLPRKKSTDTSLQFYRRDFRSADLESLQKKYVKGKPKATRSLKLSADWNVAADSAELMGFGRSYVLSYYAYETKQTHYDTAPAFWLTYAAYEKLMGAGGYAHFQRIISGQFARLLNADAPPREDGSFTSSLRLIDSIDVLPQAPVSDLLYAWGDSRNMPGASFEKERKKILSRLQLDSIYTRWDSTNYVEDPNNKGKWIMAPLKYLILPKSIRFVYRWTPYARPRKYRWEAHHTIHGYRRELESVVLEYTDRPALYLDPAEAMQHARKQGLNTALYEEQLRALLYRQAQIKAEW